MTLTRAIRVHEFGGPERLQLETVELPQPGRGEVRLRHTAIGPDGAVAGKYRKVTLPRSEVEAGVTPGDSYPVFDTRFGKVGMMVCYDGFFPEVARELSNRGAEVIAWPVWGCNPSLAAARACENHVYVVSST